MTNIDVNPRAVLGDNLPDWAKETADRIAREHAGKVALLDELLSEARQQPKEINSDDEALEAGALIKRFRDLDARLENSRAVEKEPHLRSGNAIDAFFNALRDKIGRRNKNDRKAAAGATDVLQARIDDHQERKLAEETRRREQERLAAERAAREAREKAERERREAEEAAAAAARARSPERIEQKTEISEQRAAEAIAAEVEAKAADDRAEEARMATLAKPSDMARVRGTDAAGAGVTLTVAQEPYSIVTDRMLLDKAALWPFFTDAEIEKALRGWAKTHGHREMMAGAEVGFRRKGVTR